MTLSTRSTRLSPPTRRSALWMTSAAAVAVLATAGYVFSRPPATATQPPFAPNEAPSPTPSVATEPRPSAAPSPSASAKTAVPVHVTITANAPVAEVTLGTRRVAVTPPASTAHVTLEAAEHAASLGVVARAADGRVTRATLAPRATALRLEFVSAPVTQPRPRTTAAPLATNPHQ